MSAGKEKTMARPTRAKTARAGRGSRRRRLIVNGIAVLFSAVWVFPVYWMVNTAFKPRAESMTVTPVFFPLHFTLANFAIAITQPYFLVNLRNSVIVVFGTLLLSIPLALFAAAALSRFSFRGRRTVLVLILAVQMLPATAMLIPTFLIFNSLGLVGSYLGLVLAYVATALPFSIWVLRGFFLAIPVAIEEAGRVDGAGTWTVLWRVLFPLVAPGVIATSIFSFIASWNDYLIAYTFMKSQNMYTLPVWLASFQGNIALGTGTDYVSQMAASTIFSLPIVVFFLFVQRNLVAGLSAGAVKG
jgi:N,N'-diacetylchitobiose transport system permease protein